jgi:hypothetical protein
MFLTCKAKENLLSDSSGISVNSLVNFCNFSFCSSNLFIFLFKSEICLLNNTYFCLLFIINWLVKEFKYSYYIKFEFYCGKIISLIKEEDQSLGYNKSNLI